MITSFIKRHRGLILLIAAIPAFTGMPLNRFDQVILPGITWSWTFYWLGVNGLVRVLYGARLYGQFLAVATLVTVPVVCMGGLLSFVQALLQGDLAVRQTQFSIHYLRLCINMLTVMPLSIGLAAALPVTKVEQGLLARTQGVSAWEKHLLMTLRVFHHIVFGVIPNILEVVREERLLAPGKDPAGRRLPWSQRLRFTLKNIIHVGVEGISAALQYIPLWAIEISRLPNRKK